MVPTRLIGRAQQLAELESLDGVGRIVTVVGTAGVGKTRLAIELARRREPQFPAGVWLADLGPVRSVDAVEAEVVRPLGVTPGSGDVAALVAEQLGDRRALLVLDSCEHVLDTVAPLAQRLVSACGGLSVLATSRVPLGIAGEATYLLGPLDCDQAVELFVDRAHAADASFDDSATDATVLASLCARLDGVPLALELAAPWVRLCTPAELLAQLADRLELLTADRRDLPSHQRSIRAAVEWSHVLLSQPQRVLFRRLAVFAGTFALDAAEEVCGLSPLRPGEVTMLLAGLRDHSMLAVDRHGDVSRYRLLETLRDFAREELDRVGEDAELHRRHASYFRVRAERIDEQRLRTGSDREIAALVPDADNYRAALDWSARTAPVDALRLAAALEGFWMLRSVAEGRGWVERTLEAAQAPSRHRARALIVAPYVVAGGLPWAAARRLIGESIGIYESLDDNVGTALATLTMTLAAFFNGELEEAQSWVEVAVTRPVTDHPLIAARAVCYRGAVLAFTPGGLDEGRGLLADGVTQSRAIGDGWGLGLALTTLGFADLRAGDRGRAGRHLRATLNGQLRGGVTASAVGGLGLLVAADDPRRALVLLEAATAVRQRAGVPWFPVHIGRQFSEAQEALGSRLGGTVAAYCRRGARSMTTAEVLNYALAENESAALEPVVRLTARQQEVAVLVAEGLTNREISGRLHVSVRTVETHVSDSMTALGLHRRVQLAGWVREAEPT